MLSERLARRASLEILEDIAHYNLLEQVALLTQALEGKGGYNPEQPRDEDGKWTSDDNDEQDNNSTPDETQLAQVFPLLEEPPVMPRPPFEELPQDPTISPGEGWEWRGTGPAGSNQGNWYNPGTGESLHPDMDHLPPKGPHWDYWDLDKKGYDWWPNGTMTPKPVVSIIA